MSNLRMCLVLAISWLALSARNLLADEPAQGDHAGAPGLTLSVESFRREALLSRFDADKNGTLDERERAALREAFGGVDVPMLPQRPDDYTSVRLPKHVAAAEFAQGDNSTEQNVLTNEGAALGRVLFYDTQLSRNNTVSCAACLD